MSGADRRAWLRGMAMALLFPALAALAPTARAEAARFAPPGVPMRYVRRLERSLADGEKLVVTRSFAVRFEPAGEGYRILGQQLGVETEAPEKLAAFMRIERERREDGLFPLLLDAHGRITGSEAAPLPARLDEAVREAVAMIDRRPRPAADRAELLRFVNAIDQSAGKLVSALPHDLFAPAPEPRRETREVALPGGETGILTLTFSATADPGTGLMQEAEREVLTELAGETRRTLETWRLEPLAP
jgi:hypothetical protein